MACLKAAGGHRKELTPSGDLVGSAEGADIQVSADLGLAGQHYRVGLTPTGWQLQPLAPTQVNGHQVNDLTPLSPGDQITAGSLVLEFEDVVVPQQSAPHPLAPNLSAEKVIDSTAPAASEPADPLLAALAASEAIAEKKKSAQKLTKLIIPAAAALVLGGGGLAAWKAGLLPFGKSDPSAQSADAHFDLLANFAPKGADFALSLDIQDVGKFYEHWRPKLAPQAPPLAVASKQFEENAGVSLEQFERLSVAGRSDAITAMSANGAPGNGVVILMTLSEGTDASSLLAESMPGVTETKSAAGFSLFRSPMNDGVAARVLDNRHVLFATPQDHVMLAKQKGGNPHVTALRNSKKTLALSGKFSAELLKNVRGAPVLPTAFDLDVDLPAGVDLAVGLTFANEADATTAAAELDKALGMIGRQLSKAQGEMANYGKALIARIETKQTGAKQTVSLRFTEGELAMMAEESMKAVTAQAEGAKGVRNAQNLASVYSSAMAAGSMGFEGAETKAEIAKRLLGGDIRGGGSFSETVFQGPALPDADLKASLSHLDDSFNFVGPQSSGGMAGLSSIPGLSALAGKFIGGASGAPVVDELAHSRRNAQNLISVYSSALAAGSPELSEVADLESAARKIVTGVKGGAGAGFDTVTFQVSLSEEDLSSALQHVSWDSESRMMNFEPKNAP